MSPDNVETVRRMFEAWNRSTDEHMEFYVDDAVHVTAPDWPEQGTYRGRETIRELWTYILEDHPRSSVELKSALPAGEDRVLTIFVWHLQSTHSGLSGTMDAQALWTFACGQVSRVEYFTDEAQARDAAGLPA